MSEINKVIEPTITNLVHVESQIGYQFAKAGNLESIAAVGEAAIKQFFGLEELEIISETGQYITLAMGLAIAAAETQFLKNQEKRIRMQEHI